MKEEKVMNYTQNYKLNQWEASDKVQRIDFNADNAKIDGAIAAVDTKANSKADTSALAALTATVAGKGNCQVVTGQYTGNGKAGQGSPTRLTFDRQPVLLIIYEYSAVIAPGGSSYAHYITNGTSTVLGASWEGGTVSLWDRDYNGSADHQMNIAGKVYQYIAFFML